MSLNIEISKDGYKVLRVEKDDKKVYLGSKYAQKREIDKLTTDLKEFTNKDNFIVLGLSFGEHIKELLKLIQRDSRILIVEFDKELIKYCRNDKEISEIINNDKVIIATSIEEVEAFIKKHIDELNIERLKVLTYANYDRIYTKQCQETYTLMRDFIARIKINRNTFNVFGETFLENSLSNLKYIVKSTDINQLEGVYKNKPAVIVSAGPSLIKNIDELKGNDNALILSGGRTLGALVERGINPSCVGVIDGGEVSYKLVEPYISNLDCPLVYTDLSNERIIKEHKSAKFFYTDCTFIWDIFGKEIKNLYGGGSIAHSLTKLAIYLGCNPIIFIGQDLAYTGDRGHAVCSGNRWNELTFEQYKQPTDTYVKDIYGDKVKTSLVLNEYRLAFEKIIRDFPNVKFINATEGGANIEGAENRKLQDVLKELEKEPIVSMKTFENNGDKTEDTIRFLEKKLVLVKEYIKLCTNGEKYLKNFRTSYLTKNQRGLNDSTKKLETIDKEIKIKNNQLSLLVPILTKVVFSIENDERFVVNSSDNKSTAFDKEYYRSESLYYNTKVALNISSKNTEKTIRELKGEA